jgi:hypothetical protein
MSQHWLFAALRSLSFAPEEFVIVGSAPLYVRGLRSKISDIDILARGDTWRQAVKRADEVVHGPHSRMPVARIWGGLIEVFADWLPGLHDSEELLTNPELIDGLPFARLERVLVYKRHLARPKDAADIKALEVRQSRHEWMLLLLRVTLCLHTRAIEDATHLRGDVPLAGGRPAAVSQQFVEQFDNGDRDRERLAFQPQRHLIGT